MSAQTRSSSISAGSPGSVDREVRARYSAQRCFGPCGQCGRILNLDQPNPPTTVPGEPL